MWPVSARFLASIPQPHAIETTVTCFLPGGNQYPLLLTAGTWQVQSDQPIRRTASLVLAGGSTVYDQLSTPGAVIQVRHGIRWDGTDRELVPIITGELSSAATRLGDGTVSVNLADFGQRIARNNYLAAVAPATTATRVSTIAAAVTDAIPGTTVLQASSDNGTIGVAQQWSSRTQLIQDLATDGGIEAFFRPDGYFLIRNAPRITNEPAWLLKTGPGGTVTTASRNRPLDKLFNTVIVRPASNDSSQGWTQQIAQITDPTNPRHPSRIGVSPYDWTSPTLLNASDAARIAQLLLTKVQGSTETIAIDAIANAALEAGDVIRVVTQTDFGSDLQTHLLDSITGDLRTGGMSCSTRAVIEVAAA